MKQPIMLKVKDANVEFLQQLSEPNFTGKPIDTSKGLLSKVKGIPVIVDDSISNDYEFV